MFTHSILHTVAGSRSAYHHAALSISCQLAANLAMAAMLDREADFHLSEGRTTQADRLSHWAHELRCRALGMRA